MVLISAGSGRNERGSATRQSQYYVSRVAAGRTRALGVRLWQSQSLRSKRQRGKWRAGRGATSLTPAIPAAPLFTARRSHPAHSRQGRSGCGTQRRPRCSGWRATPYSGGGASYRTKPEKRSGPRETAPPEAGPGPSLCLGVRPRGAAVYTAPPHSRCRCWRRLFRERSCSGPTPPPCPGRRRPKPSGDPRAHGALVILGRHDHSRVQGAAGVLTVTLGLACVKELIGIDGGNPAVPVGPHEARCRSEDLVVVLAQPRN